jgi:TolA-binding protein
MLKRKGLWVLMALFVATANSAPAYAQGDPLEKLRKERDERRQKREAEKAQKEAEEARKKAEEELKKAEEERKKAEEARKKAEEELKKAEEERKKAEAAAKGDKPAASATSTAKAAPSATAPKPAAEKKAEPESVAAEDVPAELASLRLSRDARRKELVQKLKERWGPLLDKSDSRAELTAHARRMAFLQRVRALAEQDKKPKVVERIDKLLTSEELRHGKAMNALR